MLVLPNITTPSLCAVLGGLLPGATKLAEIWRVAKLISSTSDLLRTVGLRVC